MTKVKKFVDNPQRIKKDKFSIRVGNGPDKIYSTA